MGEHTDDDNGLGGMREPSPGTVVRHHLSDDTSVVFVSDTHIGGSDGSDIFDSAPELSALFADLEQHSGSVELVLAGDFIDLLRLGEPGTGGAGVEATLGRREYEGLFAALHRFAAVPGHRVIYVVGNHDAEVWWNADVRRSLHDSGLVHEFALSYTATFDTLPDQVIYCEHGNQFDPTNRITDYANPLDTPVGAHIVSEVVRPIGSGMAITRALDLHDVSYVFPLAMLPEWLAGRLFYRFLTLAVRWLILPLAAVFVAKQAIIAVSDANIAVADVLVEIAFDLALLVFAFGLFFVASGRMTRWVITALASRFRGHRFGPETGEKSAIRDLLNSERVPPMADHVSGRQITVFVSGHTHAPAIASMPRAGGTTAVIANTGCWLRQLQPARAWLGAPVVFLPAVVQSHVRVHRSEDGLAVELWDHPRPADLRLPLVERVAVAGRRPSAPPPDSPPMLVGQHTTGLGTDDR